ncbi:MAG: hypothetical protein M1830_008156 [Pleopsidium flavum]|nr:MAG: hypothetical protein M1830_008156 [Pleopsidium flavum]
MASKLAWLSSLKVAHLKNAAVATGINSSGTKGVLSSRLLAELQDVAYVYSPKKGHARAREQRIISIDMGIRNLAYCVIAVNGQKDRSTASVKAAKGRQEPENLPMVERWTRIAVSNKAHASPVDATNGPTLAKVKEAFDPATYAKHAYTLVFDLLQTYQPTTVLIERQRYRSMGASAVQEWTLRVNMFEAMIHAVLETFNREGRWKGDVHAVPPSKVGPFWIGQEAKPDKKSASTKKRNKSVKIDLVGEWMRNDKEVQMQHQARSMGQAFLRKWKGGKRVVVDQKAIPGAVENQNFETDIGKLDDLADCLLQGIAWVKWQDNKRKLVDGGLDALESLD